MLFSDLHVAAYLVFVVLITWRAIVSGSEGYWPYLVGFTVLTQVLNAIERALSSGRVKADVAALASMDPAEAQATIGRFWSVSARRAYRELLGEEGAVAEVGGVEIFPYTRSARLAHEPVYWGSAALAVIAFGALFAFARHGTWIPWLLWGAGAVLVGVAGWARHRSGELASTLEVSRFGIVRVSAGGTRENIRWRDDILLQNQPRKKRMVVFSPRTGTLIALGYQRLGFVRLLRLTLEYGGFAREASHGDSDTSGA